MQSFQMAGKIGIQSTLVYEANFLPLKGIHSKNCSNVHFLKNSHSFCHLDTKRMLDYPPQAWVTCRRMLQQLLNLCWRELRPGHADGHANLLQLVFDVGLFEVRIQGGGWNPPGSPVGRPFNHIDHYFCSKRSGKGFGFDMQAVPDLRLVA